MNPPDGRQSSGKARISKLMAALVGIVVVLACVVLGGVVLVLVQHSRAVSRRIECTQNLQRLGLAMLNYSDVNQNFPFEESGRSSFYERILLVGEGSRDREPRAVEYYLCPARRTTAMAPGKRDYGYAASQPPEALSVLDTPDPPVNLAGRAALASGPSKTLVLAHVWMSPATYTGGDPTDLGWQTLNNARAINNTAKRDDDPTGSIQHIGSPHKNVMPCLFADGHVQSLPYDFSFWAQAWAWNNTQPFQLP